MNLNPVTESFGQDDQSWLASAQGTDTARSITLDTSAFTSGTHYPNGYFPSGLPLGVITATGKYGPYNNSASDGTEVLAGLLFTAIDAPSVNTIDPQGALFWNGAVLAAKLPIAVDSAGKTDVAGYIKFF
ncbi:head decoration protein [Streptomyces sp. NPDC096324]|uniref:head decoration protein n=1 Tax=Streptomyces sp. NPDC096324 TaxID=3366085 RepID=UPI003808A7A8